MFNSAVIFGVEVTLGVLPAQSPSPLAHFLLFDVALEPVSKVTGVNALAIFLPVFVVEALILWLLRWGTVGRAALGSFVMNAATTLIGAALALRFPEALPVGFLLSVAVEGVILMLLKRERKGRTWLAVLAANVASYALLFLLLASGGRRY